MRIGRHDTDERVLVIAEIGNNHEGSLERACELVEAAAAAGADAVKFQTFRRAHFGNPADPERWERLGRFELSHDQFAELAGLAHARGLIFASTPLDLDSARFLAETADCLKIASGDSDFWPLLDVAAGSDRPLIVSTGLADLDQVDRTVAFVEERRPGRRDLALLHCVASYPAPPEEVNLRAIGLLAEEFPGWTVGYSDHTLGIDVAALAVAAGARIVEKHFTLDKQLSEFRDHQLSADPDDLHELVRRIREIEAVAGRAVKEVQPSEREYATALRRSIVAARDLSAGDRVGSADVTWLRPGGGLRPGREDVVVGRTLVRDVPAGATLGASDVR